MNDLECLACVVRLELLAQAARAVGTRYADAPLPTPKQAVTWRVIISPTGAMVTVPVCRSDVLAPRRAFGLPERKEWPQQ